MRNGSMKKFAKHNKRAPAPGYSSRCGAAVSMPHLILAFAMTILPLTKAFSQVPGQPPLISVSGSAEVGGVRQAVIGAGGMAVRCLKMHSKRSEGRLKQQTGRFRLDKSA